MTRLSASGIVVSVTALLLVACGKHEESIAAPPPQAQQVPVATTNAAPVAPPPAPAPVLPDTIAQIRGEKEIPVAAKLPGYLVRQMYKENAEVKKGDVLFLMDPRLSHAASSELGNDASALMRIEAPVAGVVGAAKHGPGDWIAAEETLATVATNDVVEAEFSLAPDAHPDLLAYLQHLASAPLEARVANIELFVADGSRYPISGVVSSVRRDGKDCVVAVRFADPEHKLRVSDFVRVRSSGSL